MIVFEYVDRRGRGVITEWFDQLQPSAQAALDNKLEVLITGEPPPTLIRGPARLGGRSFRHTYKVTVDCGVSLRPLACRGPFRMDDEWTILVPVIEVGGRYNVADFQAAEDRRLEVLADRFRRRVFRDRDYYVD